MVFLIEPNQTMNVNEDAKKFKNEIVEQLQRYGVECYLVMKNNISMMKQRIDSESIVVVFNDSSYMISDDVESFMNYAKEKNANIWPIALGREKRKPSDILSKYQSYDVWEQLRCRDLGIEYLQVVARAYARKIVSKVMPTLYNEDGMIFVSHRRLDGEEITAKLCDSIIEHAKGTNIFRDVIRVEVGEEAQNVIDSAMNESNVFVFIHTKKAVESDWIQKELKYALIHNIPILWVKIDDADTLGLKIMPNEEPNLQYNSVDFLKPEKINVIADEILHATFELIMSRNNIVFDYMESLSALFGKSLVLNNKKEMLYSVSIPRKNYHYPQRDIKQYIQLFGRAIISKDIERLPDLIGQNKNYDSVAMITDKVIKKHVNEGIVVDSMEDFYNNWENYLLGNTSKKNREIIISGAFSDADEVYKQSLTGAIVIFAKSILRAGYGLTFGAHPTFQKLFFEIAEDIHVEKSKEYLKMYISKWFEVKYEDDRDYFIQNAQLYEVNKCKTEIESLTEMRKKMIERKEVAALICLGGKTKPEKSQEGIREEIAIAKEYGIPVFVVGSVGGCSAKVATELAGEKWEGINEVSNEVNQMFKESVDYFMLSKFLLSHLEKK